MEKQTDSFVVLNENGEKNTINCYKKVIDTSHMGGKSYVLSNLTRLATINGLAVNRLDGNKYQIVATGEILKKM